MKPRFLWIAVATSGLLVATLNTWSFPPVQHSATGVIASIDFAARTLTLASPQDAKPQVFIWNKGTRFTQRGSTICSGALVSGHPIKVSYRREVGEFVLRTVSLRSDAPARCRSECCDCCIGSSVLVEPRATDGRLLTNRAASPR